MNRPLGRSRESAPRRWSRLPGPRPSLLLPTRPHRRISAAITTEVNLCGALGAVTDLVVLAPAQTKLQSGEFINRECEPIISRIHQEMYGKSFEEKQALCRVEGAPGSGFLVVIFPYSQGEEPPQIQPWTN
jgi:hypothetical protein